MIKGYNKIKSWFSKSSDSTVETICQFEASFVGRIISINFFASVSVISSLVFAIIGIILLIPARPAQKDINDYFKQKNKVNLGIILENIKSIFKGEEVEVFDFFHYNNIFSLAYDSNITYYKNEGATIFGYRVDGLGKKAKFLTKDPKIGFDNDDDDEIQVY